jgi:hypothetical protein
MPYTLAQLIIAGCVFTESIMTMCVTNFDGYDLWLLLNLAKEKGFNFNFLNRDARNLLHYAVIADRPVDVIALLVAYGVNVHAQDVYGNTSVYYELCKMNRRKNFSKVLAVLRRNLSSQEYKIAFDKRMLPGAVQESWPIRNVPERRTERLLIQQDAYKESDSTP